MSWDEFNNIMKNMGGEQFNQESFKLAYDNDPKIAEIVASFDPEGINFKDKEDATAGQPDAGDQAVDAMASRATANAMS
jgi:hypothetical protein